MRLKQVEVVVDSYLVVAPRLPDPVDPAAPQTFLTVWLLSLPVALALLVSHLAVGRRRLHRFERRAGFLPRRGRKSLPASGRTTLFRVEYGSRGERVCLMVARWDYAPTSGWRRGRVTEHVWLDAEDAVPIGEERTRLEALAEELEERVDDARLEGAGERLVARIGETASSGRPGMAMGVEGVTLALVMPDFDERMAGLAHNVQEQRIGMVMAVLSKP